MYGESTPLTPLVKWHVEFVVWGRAQPAGSKRAIPIKRRDGSWATRPSGAPMTAVVDDNPRSTDWKQEVRSAAMAAAPQHLLGGPLEVSLVFVRTRPQSHYRTGRNAHLVRDSAPAYPDGRPDVLKLARAIEDALTGVVYRDDSQTVSLWAQKTWGDKDCVFVRVRQLQSSSASAAGAERQESGEWEAEGQACAGDENL